MPSYVSAACAGVIACHSLLSLLAKRLGKKDLEPRIAALEKGATFTATQAAIRKREEEFLTTLRCMKARMDQEQEANKVCDSSSEEELAALREENAKLKAQLTKHSYRIHHLVTGMEELRAVNNNNNK